MKIGSQSSTPSVLSLLKPVFNRRSISKDKSQIDFDLKTGDRFRNKNRYRIFPEWVLIAIRIAFLN